MRKTSKAIGTGTGSTLKKQWAQSLEGLHLPATQPEETLSEAEKGRGQPTSLQEADEFGRALWR